MEPDSEQTTLVDNVSVAGTVENESDENGSRSQWSVFTAAIGFSATGPDVDRSSLVAFVKKGIRSKFCLISPDILVETYKRKDSEFFEELKKTSLEKSKEISHELLLRMVVAKLEEDKRTMIDIKTKALLARKSSVSKKKPRRKEENGEQQQSFGQLPGLENLPNNTMSPTSVVNGTGVVQPPPGTTEQTSNGVFRNTTPSKKNPTAKPRARFQVIEDYPIDTADIYYLFLDIFDTTNDIQWLSEKGYNLDTVLIIHSGKELENNANNSNYYQLYTQLEQKQRQQPSNWQDIVLNNITEYVTKDIKDIYDEIAHKCYDIVQLKTQYNEWINHIHCTKLPNPSEHFTNRINNNTTNVIQETGYKYYDQKIKKTSYHFATPSLIVDAVLEHILITNERSGKADDESKDLSKQTNKLANTVGEYMELKYKELKGISNNNTSNDIMETVITNQPTLIPEVNALKWRIEDSIGNQASWYTTELNYIVERCSSIKSQVLYQLGSLDELKIEQADEILQRNHFYQKSKYKPSEIDHSLLLFEFEDMLNDFYSNLQDDIHKNVDIVIDDRKYSQQIDEETFYQQIISYINRDDIKIKYGVYPYECGVLISIIHNIPSSRIRSNPTWKSQLLSRIGFGKWLTWQQNKDTSVLPTNMFDIEESLLDKTHDSYSIYPFDGSTIFVTKYNNHPMDSQKSSTVHCRVVIDDLLFGYDSTYSSCNLVFHCHDSLFFITKDNNIVSIESTFSTEDGLSIVQSFDHFNVTLSNINRLPSSENRNKKNTKHEIKRKISITGTVVRIFSDQSIHSIRANGDTHYYDPVPQTWTYTKMDGTQEIKSLNNETIKNGVIGVATITNPDTLDTETTREDMIVTFHVVDNQHNLCKVITKCEDDTLITSHYNVNSKQIESITIESPLLPTVKIDSLTHCITTNINKNTTLELFKKNDTILFNGNFYKTDPSKNYQVTINNGIIQCIPPSVILHNGTIAPTLSVLGSYVFNIQERILYTVDSLGNYFGVSSDGTADVKLKTVKVVSEDINNDKEEQDEENELNEEEENETNNIETINTSSMSHPPKLFLWKQSGEIIEYLNTNYVNFVLSAKHQQRKENLNSIFESTIENYNNESTQLTLTLNKIKEKPTTILYRQFMHLPLLSKQDQDQLMDELELFTTSNDNEEKEDNNFTDQKQQDIIYQRIKQLKAAQEVATVDRDQKVQQVLKVIKEENNLKFNKTLSSSSSNNDTNNMSHRKSANNKVYRKLNISNNNNNNSYRNNSANNQHSKTSPHLNYFECVEGIQFLQDLNLNPSKFPSVGPKIDNKNTAKTPIIPDPFLKAIVDRSPVIQEAKSNGLLNEAKAEITEGTNRTGTPTSRPKSSSRDLLGNERKTPPKIPKSILQQTGTPNTKQISLDNSIKRKVQTSSTTKRESQGLFVIYPAAIQFVVGKSHHEVITLTNAGVDVGRFTIKQPHNKQLKIRYSPGPVAPGISVKIVVEYSPTENPLEDEIVIETELEIFRIPVVSKVL